MDLKPPLFVTYCFPPLKYPRSIQISRLLKYFEGSYTLISSEPGSDCLSEVDPSIPGLKDHQAAGIVRLHRTVSTPAWAASVLRWAKARRLLSVIQPDPYRFWARETARSILSSGMWKNHGALVTFGQPMSDHLIGLEVKRATGIPWLAHFSDPWSQSPFRSNFITHLFDRYYESNVVLHADLILVTSVETRRLLLSTYGESIGRKVAVLPHAFDPSLYEKRRSRNSTNASGFLNLAHVGNFYGHRSPDRFLDAVEGVPEEIVANVRIHFYGSFPTRSAQRVKSSARLSSTIQIHGTIPFVDSLRRMSEADGLILIDADSDESPFLPSKLIDYLGAERPIFGVTPQGASSTLLTSLDETVVRPNSVTAITERFVEYLKRIRSTRPASVLRDEVLERFDAQQLAARFESQIRDITLLGQRTRTD